MKLHSDETYLKIRDIMKVRSIKLHIKTPHLNHK